MFIYVIVCSESLKLYIGQHKGSDLRKYLSKKFYDAFRYVRGVSHLFNAMRKHPRDSWSIYPLISGIEDKKDLDELERLLIYALKAQHPDIGYNICGGGEGHNGPHTEEWKRQNSIRMKGRVISEEHRTRISAGQPRSPKQLAALDQTGRKRNPEQAEACRQNASKAMKGKKHSPETLAKMRVAAQSRVSTPEGKAQIAKAVRARLSR